MHACLGQNSVSITSSKYAKGQVATWSYIYTWSKRVSSEMLFSEISLTWGFQWDLLLLGKYRKDSGCL